MNTTERDRLISQINQYITKEASSYSRERIKKEEAYKDEIYSSEERAQLNTLLKQKEKADTPLIFQSLEQIEEQFVNKPGYAMGISFYYDRNPATQCLPAKFVLANALGLSGVVTKSVVHDKGCRDNAQVFSIEGGWGIFNADCLPMNVVINPGCKKVTKILGAFSNKKEALKAAERLDEEADNKIPEKFSQIRVDFAKKLEANKEYQDLIKKLKALDAQEGCSNADYNYTAKAIKVSVDKSVINFQEFLSKQPGVCKMTSEERTDKTEEFYSILKASSKSMIDASDGLQEELASKPEKLEKFNSLLAKITGDNFAKDLDTAHSSDDYCALYCVDQYAKLQVKYYRDVMEHDNNMKHLGELAQEINEDIHCNC